MIEFAQSVIEQLLASSLWELAAVVLAIAYLLLAMAQSRWCWPAAFFSTMIYVVLFWQSALLMESLLNAYYLAMAVYGWKMWQQRPNVPTEDGLPPNATVQTVVKSWSLVSHAKIITGLSILSAVLGYVMANFTHADFAYLDATTTVFALFATWMVTQKVLENWLYWIVIDGASIYLYIQKSFNLTAGLFMLYCVICVFGYLKWREQLEPKVATAPC